MDLGVGDALFKQGTGADDVIRTCGNRGDFMGGLVLRG